MFSDISANLIILYTYLLYPTYDISAKGAKMTYHLRQNEYIIIKVVLKLFKNRYNIHNIYIYNFMKKNVNNKL